MVGKEIHRRTLKSPHPTITPKILKLYPPSLSKNVQNSRNLNKYVGAKNTVTMTSKVIGTSKVAMTSGVSKLRHESDFKSHTAIHSPTDIKSDSETVPVA